MLESLVFLLASFGQLQRLPVGSMYLSLYEIIMVIVVANWMIRSIVKRRTMMHTDSLIIGVVLLTSLCLGWLLYGFVSLPSIMYAVRAGLYLAWAAYLTSLSRTQSRKLVGIFEFSLMLLLSLGLVQYVLAPDTRLLFSLGWDRHLGRLIGVWFDPNYTGIAATIAVLYWAVKRRYLPMWLGLIVWALTYSRASFLALGIGWLLLGLKRQLPIGIWGQVLVAMIWLVLLLPQTLGEGVRLDRTASIENRVDNIIDTAKLPSHYYLTGVGFNNYPLIRSTSLKDSHARLPDNSALAMLVTLGVWGTGIVSIVLTRVLRRSSAVVIAITASVFVHGMFNATWMFAPLWIILSGLVLMDRSEQSGKS